MKKLLKILRIIFSLSLLLSLYILISAHSYANVVSNDLSTAVFRLHVIANSDSSEDQSLKLKVRDNLLEYMNSISSECKTKTEAIKLAEENIDIFKQIAQKTVIENGYNYPINISIGNFYFPTKFYGDISLPSGYYDALKVEMGEAKGKNWWCVMFPSLCFIDINSGVVDDDAKENLKENLKSESYSVISSTSPELKFKFKIIEFFKQNELFTAKNNSSESK